MWNLLLKQFSAVSATRRLQRHDERCSVRQLVKGAMRPNVIYPELLQTADLWKEKKGNRRKANIREEEWCWTPGGKTGAGVTAEPWMFTTSAQILQLRLTVIPGSAQKCCCVCFTTIIERSFEMFCFTKKLWKKIFFFFFQKWYIDIILSFRRC